ncbi:MAG: SctF chaperone SctG [Chlamydiae bacterium CG10_big_fil_rev_8_21_14_0_10_35_9]|nr:MAG: SctF chaperone SctG [Chlamydiae bacterium CG10_big_fil_rev_8_21_14_0_10_35_9]
MSFIQDYKEDFILLLESGFIAVNQADEDAARKLFKAAELLDPKSTLPKVGIGYLHLHKLELKQAVELFESVLKEEPENEMAKTFLGLSLSFTPKGVNEAEKILESTAKSSDSLIKNLSISALDFVEKFIKKTPTPVEGMKKQK